MPCRFPFFVKRRVGTASRHRSRFPNAPSSSITVPAMEKLFVLVGALAMLVLPAAFLLNLCNDLAHPELWSDCQHDPRLYGTLAIVVIPLILWIGLRRPRK